MDALIEAHASVNCQAQVRCARCVPVACRGLGAEPVQCALRRQSGYTPLHSAAAGSAAAPVVRRLLDAGADPVVPAMVCRAVAAQRRATEARSRLPHTTQDGSFPAHLAARSGAQDVIRELVRAGMSANVQSTVGAVRVGVGVVASGVTVAGRAPAMPQAFKSTMAHSACARNDVSLLRLLVKLGADVDLANHVRGGARRTLPAPPERGRGVEITPRCPPFHTLQRGRTCAHFMAQFGTCERVLPILQRAGANPLAPVVAGVQSVRGPFARCMACGFPRLTTRDTLMGGAVVAAWRSCTCWLAR